MRNLFGHDFGALNATKWPNSKPHITHSAEDKKICKKCNLSIKNIFRHAEN